MRKILLILLDSSVGRIVLTTTLFSTLVIILAFFLKYSRKLKIISTALILCITIILGEMITYAVFTASNIIICHGSIFELIIGMVFCMMMAMIWLVFFRKLAELQKLDLVSSCIDRYKMRLQSVLAWALGCGVFVVFIRILSPEMQPVEIREVLELIVIVPIIEEFIFRFSIPTMLKLDRVSIRANLLFSAIFASFHEPGSIPIVFLYSLVLYAVINKTRKIIPAMMIHATINATVLLVR